MDYGIMERKKPSRSDECGFRIFEDTEASRSIYREGGRAQRKSLGRRFSANKGYLLFFASFAPSRSNGSHIRLIEVRRGHDDKIKDTQKMIEECSRSSGEGQEGRRALAATILGSAAPAR